MTPAPCINHPGLDSSAPCVNCGRPFCDACLVELLGARYCGPCRDQRLHLMQAQAGVGSSPTADALYAGTGTVDLGRWLSQGWSLISADLLTFAVASLLSGLVSAGTCFIGAGAMHAGLFMLVYRKMTYGHVEIGNLFEGFRRFGNAFLATLIISGGSYLLSQVVAYVTVWLMTTVGSAVGNSSGVMMWTLAANGLTYVTSMLINAGIYGMTFFAIPHVAARNVSAVDAIRASWGVFQRNPWMFVLAAFVINFLSTLGFAALCVGIFVTMPLSVAAQAQAYADHFGIEGWDAT